jgi:phenylacetate-CoA ligase
MYSVLNNIFLQPIVERRSNLSTRPYYSNLISSQFWESSKLREYQWEQISKIIQHAYTNTKFYRKRFDEADIRIKDIQNFSDFSKIPPLSREELNANLEDMLATNMKRQDIHYDSTGGSTGLSTKFARDNQCLRIKKAAEYRFNNFSEWRPGEKCLYYWPAIKDFAKPGKLPKMVTAKLFSRHLQLYAGHLDHGILETHLKMFNAYKPDLVRCFPSSLEVFAKYVKERKTVLKVKKGLLCVGESLNSYQRMLFKEVFDCNVYNCYVSRETGNIACECKENNGLHIADELLYLESKPIGSNPVGENIITDLTNYGMPLIRYRIQDASIPVSEKCACGRGLSRIQLEGARLSEYFISPVDDSFISGASLIHHLLVNGPQETRIQLNQDLKNHILVKIVGTQIKNDIYVRHIKKELNKIFSEAMKIDFEFVEEIPMLKSGKYCFAKRTFDYQH